MYEFLQWQVTIQHLKKSSKVISYLSNRMKVKMTRDANAKQVHLPAILDTSMEHLVFEDRHLCYIKSFEPLRERSTCQTWYVSICILLVMAKDAKLVEGSEASPRQVA